MNCSWLGACVTSSGEWGEGGVQAGNVVHLFSLIPPSFGFVLK
jgi:hypothetical protein